MREFDTQQDEPSEVAERFCIEHGLNKRYIPVLTENINRNLAIAQQEYEE